MAHHSHSLSGSKRRYTCPGSVSMEAPFPDTGSRASNDGTAMHEVAAWCLTQGRRAEERIGQTVMVAEGEYVDFDDDMAELVQGYVDTIRAMGEGHQVLIEQRVDVSPITSIVDQFGTADCIIVAGDELMVIDLKTGYRPVSPVDNTQLQLYALGALNLLYGKNQTQGVAPAVRPNADDDGQPDAGVVDGDALQATAGAEAQEGDLDELW